MSCGRCVGGRHDAIDIVYCKTKGDLFAFARLKGEENFFIANSLRFTEAEEKVGQTPPPNYSINHNTNHVSLQS